MGPSPHSLSMTSSIVPPYDAGTSYESGGYHDRQGLVSSTPVAKSGKKSGLYKPTSKWQWAFITTAVLQAMVALAFESYVFGIFQQSLTKDASGLPSSRTIPTYLSLLIFGFIYQLVLVYDALHYENTIQIIGLCIYNVGLLIYTAIQPDQIHDAINKLLLYENGIPITGDGVLWNMLRPFLVAVPCVLGLGTIILSFIAWKLYKEFAWNIYKQISADLRLKRRFLIYQIYIALLKFDFFLFLGFQVQFLVIVPDTEASEFWPTIAAVPITMVILLFAAWSVKRENTPGMITVIFVYVVGLAYFFFKLVRMYTADAHRISDYEPARRTLTVFAAITILLLSATIVIAIWCTTNFGKGLKPHVAGGLWGTGKKKDRYAKDAGYGRNDDYALESGPNKLYVDRPALYGHQDSGVGHGGNRMTID